MVMVTTGIPLAEPISLLVPSPDHRMSTPWDLRPDWGNPSAKVRKSSSGSVTVSVPDEIEAFTVSGLPVVSGFDGELLTSLPLSLPAIAGSSNTSSETACKRRPAMPSPLSSPSSKKLGAPLSSTPARRKPKPSSMSSSSVPGRPKSVLPRRSISGRPTPMPGTGVTKLPPELCSAAAAPSGPAAVSMLLLAKMVATVSAGMVASPMMMTRPVTAPLGTTITLPSG